MSEVRPYTPEEEKIEAGRMSLEEAQAEAALIVRGAKWSPEKSYQEISDAIDQRKMEDQRREEEQRIWRNQWEARYREAHQIPEGEPIDLLKDLVEAGPSRLHEGDASLIRGAERWISNPNVGVYKTPYSDAWRTNDKDKEPWSAYLSEKIKGKVLVDFGGDEGRFLEDLVTQSQVTLYVIVDRYVDKKLPSDVHAIIKDEMLSSETRKITIQADMLEFADQLKDGTVNVTINGIDMEAILGPVVYEEYGKRLREEVLRITEQGGVMFGDSSPLSRFAYMKNPDIAVRDDLLVDRQGVGPHLFEKRDRVSREEYRTETITKIAEISADLLIPSSHPDMAKLRDVVSGLRQIHEDQLANALAPFANGVPTLKDGKLVGFHFRPNTPVEEGKLKDLLQQVIALKK